VPHGTCTSEMLSKRNDKSTSLERQRAETQAKADALGIDELVIVEDPAVSAFRVHPLKRLSTPA
jgi:hypothetical protein